MGAKSTRDGRRQSRIVTGDDEGMKVWTVNHHRGGSGPEGELRLDATITYKPGGEDVLEAHGHVDFDHDYWFAAYTPVSSGGGGHCALGGLLLVWRQSPPVGSRLYPFGAWGSGSG